MAITFINGQNGQSVDFDPDDPRVTPASFLRSRLDPMGGDPAESIPGMAPNFGRPVVPHIVTYQSIVGSGRKVYRDYDEAVKASLDNARYMRNDCGIMECVEARQRCVALLDWHLQPEDDKSTEQKALCDELTKILNRIRLFTEYRYNLMSAIWYGKYAIQNRYSWQSIGGQQRLIPTGGHADDLGWQPINGDKLVFRYDDGNLPAGAYGNQMGVRVGSVHSVGDLVAGRWRVEMADRSMAYFLSPWERKLVTVHRHMIEDAAFEDAISAGSINGVGIRSRIYWDWVQKQETLAFLMEYLERSAGGFQIWKYPLGNQQAKEETERAAKQGLGGNRSAVIVPVPIEDQGQYGVQVVEPGMGGIEAVQFLVTDYFGHRAKRYILGQTLTSEAAATGLGSGVAEAHKDTYMQIIRYDAMKLQETITHELVRHVKDFNFPQARGIHIEFKIDVDHEDVKEKLEAWQTAYNMGASFRERDVMEMIGAAMPGPDDKVLKQPDQSAMGVPGAPGGVAPAAAMTTQQFEHAFTNGAGDDNGPDEAGGGSTPENLGPPPNPGDAGERVKVGEYSRHPLPGQRSMLWHEEEHPRDDAGMFVDETGHNRAGAEPHPAEGPGNNAGPAGITKHEAIAQAMEGSNRKVASYEQSCRATYLYTGTAPSEWGAVKMNGMQTVSGPDGDVSMPVFEFPRGYSKAPTIFESDGLGHCCELCGHDIKKAYHIQHDGKKWTMTVGSECVTNFTDGKSGAKLAKESQYQADRDFVSEAQAMLGTMRDWHRKANNAYGGDGVRSVAFAIKNANVRKAYWAMIKSLGYDTMGYRTNKWLLLDDAAVENDKTRGHRHAEKASDRIVSNWVAKHGDSVREQIDRLQDFIRGGGEASETAVEQYARRTKLKPSRHQKQLIGDDQQHLRWITLHGGEHGNGEGSVHVQIDDRGNIHAGPAGLAEKGIHNLHDFGSAKHPEGKAGEAKAAKVKKPAPAEHQPGLFEPDEELGGQKRLGLDDAKQTTPSDVTPEAPPSTEDVHAQRRKDFRKGVAEDNRDIDDEHDAYNWLDNDDDVKAMHKELLKTDPRYRAMSAQADAVSEQAMLESEADDIPLPDEVKAASNYLAQKTLDAGKYVPEEAKRHFGLTESGGDEPASASNEAAKQPEAEEAGGDESASEQNAMTYEQFESEYRKAFAQANKYGPNAVGGTEATQRMADLADQYPEWAERVESEGDDHASESEPDMASLPIGKISGGRGRFDGATSLDEVKSRMKPDEKLSFATYGGGTQAEIRDKTGTRLIATVEMPEHVVRDGNLKETEKGGESEPSEAQPEDAVNPFRQQADDMQKRIDRLTGGSSHDQEMRKAFPLGTGRPGNASSRSTSKRSDQRIEKTIDDAKKATELISKRNALNAQAAAFDAGTIDGNGNPTEAAIAQRTKKADALDKGKAMLSDFYRDTMKPGDLVHLADNPRNTLTIKRVNKNGITAESGSTWKWDEIIPQHEDGRAMTVKETIDSMRAWEQGRTQVNEEQSHTPVAESPAVAQSEPEPAKPEPSGPLSLAMLQTRQEKLHKGETTAAEVRQWYAEARDPKNLEAIKAELSKKTVAELKAMGAQGFYGREKKADLIESILNQVGEEYHVGDRGVSFTIGGPGYKKSKEDAYRKAIESQTDEHIKAHAERVAGRRAEYQARREGFLKSVENPETVEDFDKLVRVKGEDSLTPEQAAKYDDLQAERRRGGERAKAAEVKGFSGGEDKTGGIGIVEGHHQKRNQATHTVTVENRLGEDGFAEAVSKARALGGSYVNARIAKAYGATAGFQFFDKGKAEQFADLLRGKSVDRSEHLEERESERAQSAGESLASKAASLASKAEQDLNRDRQTNTARRAAMAASAEASARKKLSTAKTLDKIGEAISSGDAKHLSGLRHVAQVETLDSILNRTRYERWNDESAKRRKTAEQIMKDSGGKIGHYESHQQAEQQHGKLPSYEDFHESPHSEDDIRAAKYPYPRMLASDLKQHAEAFADIPGLKKIAATLKKSATEKVKFQGSVNGMKASGGELVAPKTVEEEFGGKLLRVAPEKRVRVHQSWDWRLAQSSKEQGGRGTGAFYTADKGKTWSDTPTKAVAVAHSRGNDIDLVDAPEDKLMTFDQPDDIKAMSTAAKRLKRSANPSLRRIGENLSWQLEDHDRLQRMDIKTPAELRAALREYVPLKSGVEKADPVKQKERALIGRKIDGFFPTPRPLVDRMLDQAQIEPGMSVLEPSAGKGDILDAIRERQPEAHTEAIEPVHDLRDIIEAKGHKLAGNDFLEHKGQYDRIVMNPPFEKGADIDHVRHAYDQLKPGGKLVAIMSEGPFSRGDKKASEFRDWLEEHGGEHEENPEGSFSGSDAFRKTGVNTRMVTISKPTAEQYSRRQDFKRTVSAFESALSSKG